MLYLVDSSAEGSRGHNLEYLKRLTAAVEFVTPTARPILVVNRNCPPQPDIDSPLRPALTISTSERGRYWIRRGQRSRRLARRDLHATKQVDAIRTSADVCRDDRRLGSHLRLAAQRSNQAMAFCRDLFSVVGADPAARIFLSSSNEREVAGLVSMIQERAVRRHATQAFVMLRAPMRQSLGFGDWLFELLFERVRKEVLKGASRWVTFLADTPQLVDYYRQALDIEVHLLEPPGFVSTPASASKAGLVLSPGRREDTREGLRLSSTLALDSLCLSDLEPSDQLSSETYARWLSKARMILLPYDPTLYRYRSSGVLMEALSVATLPIVPTGTSMSSYLAAKSRHQVATESRPSLERELGPGEVMRFAWPDSDHFGYMSIHMNGPSFSTAVVKVEAVSARGRDTTTHNLSWSARSDGFMLPADSPRTLSVATSNGSGSPRVVIRVRPFSLDEAAGLSYRPRDIDAALSFGASELQDLGVSSVVDQQLDFRRWAARLGEIVEGDL